MNKTPTNKQIEGMRAYYDNHVIQKVIFTYIQNREVSFIPSKMYGDKKPLRMVSIRKPESIGYFGGFLYYTKNPKIYNWYMSVAELKFPVPYTSLKWEDRIKRNEIRVNFNKTFLAYIKRYPWIIDIDAPEIQYVDMAHEDAVRVWETLNSKGFRVMFAVFSGCGFHLHIDFPKTQENYYETDDTNIFRRLTLMTKELHDTITNFIDYRIYDSKRLIKIPYSLAIYEHGIYICKVYNTIGELKTWNLKNCTFNHDKYLKLNP